MYHRRGVVTVRIVERWYDVIEAEAELSPAEARDLSIRILWATMAHDPIAQHWVDAATREV